MSKKRIPVDGRAHNPAREKLESGAKKVGAQIKQGAKNAGKQYVEGLKDMAVTSGKMIYGALGDVILGKNPIRGMLKQGVDYAKRGNDRFVSVVKGFFNDPKWYSYHGETVPIPVNTLRPFDYRNVTGISNDTYKLSPGTGVTHVIQNNIMWGDVFDTEAFDLATAEAFRIMRENLKSNLIYGIEDFRNFVKATMSLIATSKAIEKALGWYTAVREDMPDLHDAMTHVPVNTTETGTLNQMEISCLSDENYADTITKFGVLKDYCAQIAVPQRLVEYLSWWVGGTFIDQSQPNPQIYTNMLRYCPIYAINTAREFITLSDFDIATCNIDDIIYQAKLILNNCGVINADVIKAGLFGYLGLVSPDQYNAVAIDDKEFFNVLINSYSENPDAGAGMDLYTHIFDEHYTRFDMLPEVDMQHALGGIMALGHAFGITVPMRVHSQAAYISNNRCSAPANASFTADASTIVYQSVAMDGNYFIQFGGQLVATKLTQVIAATDPIEVTASYYSRLQSAPNFTPTSASLLCARTWTIRHSPRNPYPTILGKGDIGGTTYYLLYRIWKSGGVLYSGFEINDKSDGTGTVLPIVQPTPSSTIALNSETTADGYEVWVARSPNGNMFSGVTDANLMAMWRAIFEVNGEIYRPDVLYVLSLDGTTTNLTYNVYSSIADYVGQFCELVDYHIPMFVKTYENLSDNINNIEIEISGNAKLYKECYIPASIDKDNVRYIIYHMLLGLFSIN